MRVAFQRSSASAALQCMRSCRLPCSSVTTTQLIFKGRLRSTIISVSSVMEFSKQTERASCDVVIAGCANKVMQDMVVYLLSFDFHYTLQLDTQSSKNRISDP